MIKEYLNLNRNLTYYDLGTIDYKVAWDLQKRIFELRYQKEIDDVLLLLEHPHTYTLGKTARRENLICTEDYLEQNHISVYNIDRGGDITYHGKGQIVGYPIFDLKDWVKDTHKYLRALEEVLIKTCEEYDLKAGRIPGLTGVWIENRKIAAIGIKVSRWITMHGFAFNVNTDLNLYKGIIPCGISDKEVTSLKRELNKDVDLAEVKSKILNNIIEIFNYDEYKVKEPGILLEKNLNKV